jgi:hypothetical protein
MLTSESHKSIKPVVTSNQIIKEVIPLTQAAIVDKYNIGSSSALGSYSFDYPHQIKDSFLG